MMYDVRLARVRRSALARVLQVAVIAGLLATACAAPAATTPQIDPLSGRYRVSGGGGTIPLITNLTKRFTELHPGVIWDIENVGSDAAIASVKSAEADLGGVSREMTAPEKASVGVVQIGQSGTAIAVNASHSVTNLTKDQVRKIFSGEIKDWSQVGASPGEIKVFVREPSAATRQIFDEYIFGGKAAYRTDYTPVDSADSTMKALTSFKDAVSMLTITEATLKDPTIKLVSLDGVAPSNANLASGTYPMRRPLYMVYNSTKAKPAITAFVEFTKGPEGQKILTGK
jgi:phosphate transport system substrate-binding protein